MTVIGVTGRTGSGKSTLCKYFAARGVQTIDCDLIAREVTGIGSPCLIEIVETFGQKMLLCDGSLNRIELAELVFSNKQALKKLDAITHPIICDVVVEKLQKAYSLGEKIVFIDAALLVGYPLEHYCDKIVVVKAKDNLLKSRLKERSGLSGADAEKRLSSQSTDKQLVAAADYVVVNHNDITELHKKGDVLLRKLLLLSKKNTKSPPKRKRLPHIFFRFLPFIIAVPVFILLVIGAVRILNIMEHEVYKTPFEDITATTAAEFSLDKYLVYAVIKTESNFIPLATSNVGARGLMQLTEETFSWVQSKIDTDYVYTFDDMYSPDINIYFGCYYISRCLQRYGDDHNTAIAAYHSGWGTVDKLLTEKEYSENGKILNEFPYPQMNLYVKKVTSNYQSYKKIYPSQE